MLAVAEAAVKTLMEAAAAAEEEVEAVVAEVTAEAAEAAEGPPPPRHRLQRLVAWRTQPLCAASARA